MWLFSVLPAEDRCPPKLGPRTARRRLCNLQAFCPGQNLGAGAIHLPRAFERSQDSIKITTPSGVVIFMEAPPRIELGNKAFAELCLTAWLWRPMEDGKPSHPHLSGAGDEARTRYLHLGKVALYQMSYTRVSRCISVNAYIISRSSKCVKKFFPDQTFQKWCLRSESLFCGKATAVSMCHRHIVKSRLSIPHESTLE